MILHVWQRLVCRDRRHLAATHRIGRILWWTLTLQLPRRIGLWRRARQARLATSITSRDPLPLLPVPSAEQVEVPRHQQPVVSVIIPTYGQTACTLRCLSAIAAHPPNAPIEVIVVDDASPDPEVAQLAHVRGIRLIHQPRNLGFLRTCNEAAKWAVGEHLLFLNNDTQPCPGWLDAMLDLLRTRADAGAVGAKLLYPDGRLQEAGGIIWNDATGWNYGRGDDPARPEYNYVRDVDYCSGAALMVRRALFARLGGFDPRYAPAYFEDSDLAFRLRALGFATLYQPRAEVVHIEGASHGTDTARGVKAHQEINRDVFVARWADVLATQHVAPGAQVLRARDRAFDRPVVLVIDHRVPEPDRDAGSRTMGAFVAALRGTGAVVKFWADCPAPQPAYDAALQLYGVEVLHGDWAAFIHWVATNGAAVDHVLLSRPEVADRYLLPLRRYSRARATFYGHDLHHDRMRQQAVAAGDPVLARAARRMLRRERWVWRHVDTVLYPSRLEVDRVTALEPRVTARVVQPYSFQTVAPPRTPAPDDIVLFVAGFAHPPNEDAACWLARDIVPAVRRHVPSARLAIVGSQPSEQVRALGGGDVIIAADVSDAALAAWYARARVAVVPLRQGAGVKRKVVEALAEGLPLVTTPIGAQGLPGLDAVASVCSTAETIAAAIVALLRDDVLWRARGSAGIAYVRAHFSPAGLQASLLDAIKLPNVAAQASLPPDATQHRQPLLQVSDQVLHVLEPDMQPHQRSRERPTGGAGHKAGRRQRETLEPAPGCADPEQRQSLDERVGALD
jgi:GT2 family glycosyltransferase